jgi:16S rRNA (cytidine1402-2'-O)-methyltransferase
LPTLYIVATPIGNLEDVTLRALRVLGQVRLIAAEDTRTTRKLLARYDIHTPVTSFHDRNAGQKLPRLLATLGEGDVALVSEAGMPGISDPGYELVTAAVARQIPVAVLPGPSAVTAALAVSGLPADQFLFLGFLPRRASARRTLLTSLAQERRTLVAFEAPHRLRESLQDVLALLGDRRAALCRELTKLHEEVFRGRVREALAHFTEPRGEFTLVLKGASATPPPQDTEETRQRLLHLRQRGLKAREAVAQVAEATGLPHRQVYRLWLELPPS